MSWTVPRFCCATSIRTIITGSDSNWSAGPRSPRDAVGATVYLTADGMRQRGDVLSGGSFASSNDQRVHFGLGDSTSVDQVEIHWPDRTVQKLKLSGGVDRFYNIEEDREAVPLDLTAHQK